MRVAGWREFQRVFGDLVRSAHTPYAARGYFANGGEVAHVIRLVAATSATATAQLDLGTLDAHGKWAPPMPARADFSATSFRIDATSPGGWANGTQVELRYRSSGPLGTPRSTYASRPRASRWSGSCAWHRGTWPRRWPPRR